MEHTLRSNTSVKLVGQQCEIISGARLPSIRQVMAAFYYQLRTVKLPIRPSARKTVKQVIAYWEKTKIPIIQEIHCISKIESLHAELTSIWKHMSRRSSKAQLAQEIRFCEKLDTLFDIAKTTAIPEMEKALTRERDPIKKRAITEDMEFLKNQKEGHRVGCIGGIDGALSVKMKKKTIKIKRRQESQKLLDERREKNEAQSNISKFCIKIKCIKYI